MKIKYTSIFLVLFSSNVYSGDAFNMCKNNILASKPYGKNATVEQPKDIRTHKNEIIFNWEGMGKLVITDKNGQKSLSLGRCVYNEKQSKITFLIVYGDVLVSKYANDVRAINASNSDFAYAFSEMQGLSKTQIAWLKRNGQTTVMREYNPNGEVLGFVKHSKSDLEYLDRLQIINLYPNNHNDNLYTSVPTDISRALSKKL